MNSLYHKINNKFINNCYLKASDDSLKMEVYFTYEDNEEEEEEKEVEKEEKEKEEENENKHFGDCKMKIELFKYEKGKYLLEFLRTGGKFPDYYQHFLEIKKLISKKF